MWGFARTAQLACDLLEMALWQCKRPGAVIFHTDRADYQVILKRHNLRGKLLPLTESRRHSW